MKLFPFARHISERMARRQQHPVLAISSFFLLLLLPLSCSNKIMLERGQVLPSDDELISEDRSFTLQFAISSSSALRSTINPPLYLTIRYNDDYPRSTDDTVWIGNWDNRILNATPSLTIDEQGSLKILQGKPSDAIVLYSARNPMKTRLVLESNGNLRLQEISNNVSIRVLWQSFDLPMVAWLPEMKIGLDLKTGTKWTITSFRSEYSLDRGSFTLGINPESRKRLAIWQNGELIWESMRWNGSAIFESSSYNFNYVSNEREVYFTFTAEGHYYPYPMLTLSSGGALYESPYHWSLAYCGYSQLYQSSGGCLPRELPECRKPEDANSQSHRVMYGLMSVEGFTLREWDNLSLADCGLICLRNCSCVAYAVTNDDDKTGCQIWNSIARFAHIDDSRESRSIYFINYRGSPWWKWVAMAVGGVMVMAPLISIIWAICLKFQEANGGSNQKKILKELATIAKKISPNQQKDEEDHLRIFGFEIIAAATNYFSSANKLGEGGYGPVYKGMLGDGQEIAVKRLSRNSGQGLTEFKNEAILIAKLQHRNLVRLLGFCIQGEEKMLIYELMSNKSLDFIIFDPDRSNILDWKMRFVIIKGIAQGLLYLHEHSRLRVIHRDLKASNILLDDEMNPKISDFGLARIFGLHETEANTCRIVGTHGYMAPEYAFQGIVSIKLDVYSFGVIILEIVSGKKNTSLYHSEHLVTLIGFAWQLWNEGRALELKDPSLDNESCLSNEVLRCIHMALLCVQENASDRPTMSEVVSLLNHQTIPAPAPKRPAFLFSTTQDAPDAIEPENCSINQVSLSIMEAR